MKTSVIIVILGAVIGVSTVFGLTFKFPVDSDDQIGFGSPFIEENYEITITGMKDVYLVGEPYDFSYILSGYGHSCMSKTVNFPDANGERIRIFVSSSCVDNEPMRDFVLDIQKEQGTTYGHVGIKNPGNYNVLVELNYEGIWKAHEFFVVEKNCDELISSKSKAKCFFEASQSCESAYMTQAFPAENGGTVTLRATVDSWNDCQLKVYTENSLGDHSSFNGIRSICDNVIVDEDSLKFETCNNADYPPIMFDFQDNDRKQIESIDDFDKTFGGPGNRHPAFLGYDIPEICSEEMIKHLVRYSTMFDRGVPFSLEWIGFEHAINADDFDQCVEELLERNPKELEIKN